MEDLISKREVLEHYGISYGALYRWKRLGLIPEDWFLKKSTETGQETFFHRGQICPRIEAILSRPESVSLEQMARELSGKRQSVEVAWLIVSDGFRTVRIRMDELKEARIVRGKQETDILNNLKGALSNDDGR